MGQVVRVMLLKALQDEQDEVGRHTLSAIAKHAPEGWRALVASKEPNDKALLVGVTEPDLVKYLVEETRLALDPERWATVLDRWAAAAAVPPLSGPTRARVMKAIGELFGVSLREGLKYAWATSDRAWPAFQIDLAVELAERAKNGIDPQSDAWRNEMVALGNGLTGIASRVDALDRESRERHKSVIAALNDLSSRLSHLETKMDRVLELAEQRDQIERVLRGERPELRSADIDRLIASLEKLRGRPDFERAFAEAARGNLQVAKDIWRQLFEDRRRKGQTNRREQAEAARQYAAVAFVDEAAEGLEWYRKATDLDPEDMKGWHDLGDAERSGGTLPGARRAFERYLELARARVNEANVGDASDRLGDVLVAEGKLPDARRAFEDGLAIATRLAASNPTHAERQVDVAISHYWLGSLGGDDRRRHLSLALDILGRLHAEGRLTPDRKRLVARLERMLDS